MMMDDAGQLDRQAAYLDTVRSLYRAERNTGFVASLVGVLVLIVARFRPGEPHWMLWAGGFVVALGWGLFVYAIIRRLQWVRAHPFEKK